MKARNCTSLEMELLLVLLTLMWDAGVVWGQTNNPNQCSRFCGTQQQPAYCYGHMCCRGVNCQVTSSCPPVPNAADPCGTTGTSCGRMGNCINSGKCCYLLDCTPNAACSQIVINPTRRLKGR